MDSDDDLPIPGHSLPAELLLEQPQKKPRLHVLPMSFLAVVRQVQIVSIVAVIHVTQLLEYADSEATTPQYLNILATNGVVDKTEYVEWHLCNVAPLQTPVVLTPEMTAGNSTKFAVGKYLNEVGYSRLMDKQIDLNGSALKLRSFLKDCKKQLHCFRMDERVWEDIRHAGLRVIVTPISVLAHAQGFNRACVEKQTQHCAAISEDNRREQSEANTGQRSSAAAAADDDDDEQSGDSDNEDDHSQHGLDIMANCMRLSMLMKNASNLKDAIKFSLAAFSRASKARCPDLHCIANRTVVISIA